MGDTQISATQEADASASIAAARKMLAHLSEQTYRDLVEVDDAVAALQHDLSRKMVEQYDPGDDAGFAHFIHTASRFFDELKFAADQFGVSVSTVHRWRNGESVPHKLMRKSVKTAVNEWLLINPRVDGADVPSGRSH